MRLIDKDHMIYRLEQASKYFGGKNTDTFDERFSQGLKESSIKVAEELEIQAVPIEEVIKIIEFEEKWLSQTRMSIRDIDMAFNAMKSKIKQIEG
jgi:hypothetical protein